MNWLALTAGRNTPSARFRVRQYLDLLRQKGILVEESYPLLARNAALPGVPSGVRLRYVLPWFIVWQLMKLLTAIPGVIRAWRADAVWVQRPFLYGIPTLEWAIKKPFVLDVDDALWEEKPAGASALKSLARRAECVVVGNAYLAGWFSQYSSRVELVPTAIDTERFFPKQDAGGGEGRFVIGWTGTRGNLKYVYEIEDALAKFLASEPRSQVHVLCDEPPEFDTIPKDRVEYTRWTPGNEAEVIRHWDVGLMPLSDDAFSRGKCSFKMLQYMATGIPVVVSPVGMNAEILSQGELGFAARSHTEWVEALEFLIGNPEKAAEMGRIGRCVVENRYSRAVVSAKLAEILKSI